MASPIHQEPRTPPQSVHRQLQVYIVTYSSLLLESRNMTFASYLLHVRCPPYQMRESTSCHTLAPRRPPIPRDDGGDGEGLRWRIISDQWRI